MDSWMSASALCSPLLRETRDQTGRPASRELLERAHVEIAVVKKLLERRHVPREEAPVLADAVAAHRRRVGFDEQCQRFERALFRARHRVVAVAHALDEAGSAMRALVPFVHGVQHSGRLVNRDHGPFGDDVEIHVGDDGGHLDDHVGVGLEARHLEIYPDEIVAARHRE